ncbi:MAG: tryptophan synthase subunit alpha [Pseudomonadota bacterium]
MTRIATTFQNLKAQNKSAFISFVTAGDPDYQTSLEIIKKLPENGVDIIELGIPFLDPAGDGPTIEAASKRAILNGMNLHKVLQMVKEFRIENKSTPIVLMGYYNPILHYGLENFCVDAAKAGVDGLLVVDLPPEEDVELRNFAEQNHLDFIKLVALTSDENRIKTIAKNASGFLYLVSILGITGTKSANLIDLKNHLQKIKNISNLPVAVGFGIKSKEQIKEIENIGAEAVVVGSALVKIIEENLNNNEIVNQIINKLKNLTND